MTQPRKPVGPAGKTGILAGSLAALLGLGAILAETNEGVVLSTYPDPVWGWRVPTACMGDTGPHIQRGMTFTRSECLKMMGERHAKTWASLEKCIKRPIEIPPALALLSLADNVGVGPVCSSTALKMHNNGEPPSLWCKQFVRWRYVGGKDCADVRNNCMGIPTRRSREMKVCMGDLTVVGQ